MTAGIPILISVVGAGHSGSTLLDTLLSNHPEVSGVGEVQRISVDPADRECGCGRLIPDCPYWKAVAAEMEGRTGVPVGSYADRPVSVLEGRPQHRRAMPSLDELLLLLGSGSLYRLVGAVRGDVRRIQSAARRSWELFEAVAALDGTSAVVDSSKDSHRMKYLYLEHPDRVRVIHLIRDGRAVVSSHRRRDGVPLEPSARMWNNRNRNAGMMLRSIPGSRKLRLRYEDLCTDLDGELQRIFEFVGLPYDRGLGRLGERELHPIPGNAAFLGRKDIEVRLDERWKEEFTPADYASFDRIAGRRARHYGYK